MYYDDENHPNYVLLHFSPLVVFVGNTCEEWWDDWGSYVVIPTPERIKHVAILSDN